MPKLSYSSSMFLATKKPCPKNSNIFLIHIFIYGIGGKTRAGRGTLVMINAFVMLRLYCEVDTSIRNSKTLY